MVFLNQSGWLDHHLAVDSTFPRLLSQTLPPLLAKKSKNHSHLIQHTLCLLSMTTDFSKKIPVFWTLLFFSALLISLTLHRTTFRHDFVVTFLYVSFLFPTINLVHSSVFSFQFQNISSFFFFPFSKFSQTSSLILGFNLSSNYEGAYDMSSSFSFVDLIGSCCFSLSGFCFSNNFVWFFCRKLSWNWMFLMKNLSKKLWVLCLAYQVFNFILVLISYPLCFVWLLRKQRNWKYIISIFWPNKVFMCRFIERTQTLYDSKYKINPMISVNGLSLFLRSVFLQINRNLFFFLFFSWKL